MQRRIVIDLKWIAAVFERGPQQKHDLSSWVSLPRREHTQRISRRELLSVLFRWDLSHMFKYSIYLWLLGFQSFRLVISKVSNLWNRKKGSRDVFTHVSPFILLGTKWALWSWTIKSLENFLYLTLPSVPFHFSWKIHIYLHTYTYIICVYYIYYLLVLSSHYLCHFILL